MANKEKAIKEKKSKETKPKEPKMARVKASRSAQNSIPYKLVYEDGTILNDSDKFTRAYKLEDINFKIAPEEEQFSIFRAFGQFLNSFDQNAHFQFVIHNHDADKRTSISNIRFLMQRDGLNKYRQEMNNVLIDKMARGRNNLLQDKYIVISQKDENVDHAMNALDALGLRMNKELRKVTKGPGADQQSAASRVETLFSIYNQDHEKTIYNAEKDGQPYFDLKKVYANRMNTKDIIAPGGIQFLRDHFRLGGAYGRTLGMSGVANFLTTEFLSDLSDVPVSMLLSVHYECIDTEKAHKIVKNHMVSIDSQVAAEQKRAAASGYTLDLISPTLSRQQEQARELMRDISSRDQKMFNVTLTVTVFGETKQDLEDGTQLVRTVANTHLCPLQTLAFQQEDGFNASLPLCENKLHIRKMLTTESASIFLPYTNQEIHQKKGVLYGINPSSNNLIVYSRQSGNNGNGLIFGEPGSGKSMAAKMEMTSVLLRSDKNQVFVIDPEAEYAPLARALGGEVIDLSPQSLSYVNPLDMDINYGDAGSPLSMKADYVISMIEIMNGGGHQIEPDEKSVIDRCVKNIYRGYMEHMEMLRSKGDPTTCDKDAMPTLSNLYQELLIQTEPAAKNLANILEIYATGSLSTFSHRSNVETTSNMVVYDIRNLGTGMKDLGLHVCLNDIWNKTIANKQKGIWTWIYIDEFYLLLQSDAAAKFLKEIWKRARKWNGVPTGIMQNTEDLLRTADSRNIINNTSFVLMYSLPKADRLTLADLLQISDAQLDYITNGLPGHGLLYNGKTTIPLNGEFPEDTELYKLMSTSDDKDRFMRGMGE